MYTVNLMAVCPNSCEFIGSLLLTALGSSLCSASNANSMTMNGEGTLGAMHWIVKRNRKYDTTNKTTEVCHFYERHSVLNVDSY